MTRTKVLFVVHGHPAERPGGAEVYAWELYQAMRARPDFEPFVLTRTEKSPGPRRPPVWADPADPHHFWLSTPTLDFDVFYQENRSAGAFGPHLDRLLRHLAPDVVHVQHTLFVGMDFLTRVREQVPRAKVAYTLHEFFPICHHRGLLYRTHEPGPCTGASPARCHGCFPDIGPESFAARERFVKTRLATVDRFVAPSRFLRDRYVDWGVPPDRIVCEEYGRLPRDPVPAPDRPRTTFGYFGQVNAFKGIDVLLKAALLLAAEPGRPPFAVEVHGANLELQPWPYQTAYRELLAKGVAAGVVTDRGPYPQDQLPRRMASADWVVVPSVWWENSPLVIQEAFQHGRPVIASDIGAMAEKVAAGADGLHFRAGDPAALAKVMREAVTTPGLWERLRAGIKPVYPMAEHVRRLGELYAGL